METYVETTSNGHTSTQVVHLVIDYHKEMCTFFLILNFFPLNWAFYRARFNKTCSSKFTCT